MAKAKKIENTEAGHWREIESHELQAMTKNMNEKITHGEALTQMVDIVKRLDLDAGSFPPLMIFPAQAGVFLKRPMVKR